MEDCLYDTSWTLHALTHSSSTFNSFCAFNEQALKRPAKQLKDFLSATPAEKRSLYENEQSDIEKTGTLREVIFRPLEHPAILITLTHEHALSKFILYGAYDRPPYSLLLTKAAAPLVHKVTAFLFETFSASFTPLKLPSTLLYDTLQSYMSIVTTTKQDTQNQLSKSTLSTLRMTFAFSPPVSPKLKSIDIDIPLASLLAQTPGRTILTSIATHLERATGIYPLAIGLGMEAKEGENEKALARISKVSCAAFALSMEGRLKYTLKAVEGAVQFEDTARRANRDMLTAIVAEASQRREGNG
jgi:Kinetochore complex Sim4 subunit Fta1